MRDQANPQGMKDEDEEPSPPPGEESVPEGSTDELISGTEESSEEELETMRSNAKKARAEAAEYKDQLQRCAAELQNLHRRVARDMEKARAFALRDFVRSLVPSMDNLERALQVPPDQTEALRDGVQMVHQEMLKTLEKFHIEVVCPEGEVLDPNLHEAVMRQAHPSAEENTILQVFEKGYKLREIVIRPARVIVASGENPEAAPESDTADPEPNKEG